MLSLRLLLCLVSNLKRVKSLLFTLVCLVLHQKTTTSSPGSWQSHRAGIQWRWAEAELGEAGARFGDQGWEPSTAVQAAQLQGQVSVMSSSVWKSLISTHNKNPSEGCLQCFVIKINSFLILLFKRKKSLFFPWPSHFIKMLPLNRFYGCNSQDASTAALLVSMTHLDMHN